MTLVSTAFLMGLFGLIHCVTMCGSLSMALGFSIPRERSFLLYSSLISIGRVSGYVTLGVLANMMSQGIVVATNGSVLYLSVLASLLMIGIGLHVANLSNRVLMIEHIGKWFERVLAPVKKSILPIDSWYKCLLYGVFWGFLPCGLVYTALSLAILAPSTLVAGMTMAAFGVATLPALIGLTAFNTKLSHYLQKTGIRLLFGLIIVAMALYSLSNSIFKIIGT